MRHEANDYFAFGHRTGATSRVMTMRQDIFILDHCRKENIDIQSPKQMLILIPH